MIFSNRTVSFAEIVRDASAAKGVLGGRRNGLAGYKWSFAPIDDAVRAFPGLRRVADHGDGTLSAVFSSNAAKVKLSVEAASLAFKTAVAFFGKRKIQPGDPRSYVTSN